VSFLFPLFLLAGLTIAIPILIHLFNLRRYKTIYFPNTRFLRTIQLHSQKQSQLRYKWLLAVRILFLLFLVLAFAQPFFQNNKQGKTTDRLQIIYVDNSSSMSVKNGARTLLEIAKENARKQIQHASLDVRFILLTNDKPVSYQPMPPERALAALNGVDITAASKPASQIFSTVQGLAQSEAASGADIYYYSDFQQNSFPAQPVASQLAQIHFYGIPVRAETVSNVFIDTAFLTSPVLQTGQTNKLIVKSRLIGKAPKEPPIVQLSVNGQVKSAASLNLTHAGENTDTLSFQVNKAGWQKLRLTVNDAAVRFDDTFRITARSSSSLAVLVLNEGQPNPYIQAAFSSYNGFRMDQKAIVERADWKPYNLIVLNGITRMDETLSKSVTAALQQGQSVVIFPGRTNDISALNQGLSKIADIRISGIDTATQTATNLQPGSELVRDLFERIPENVQLPVANWHYIIDAGLAANQQSVLSFRNGDPLLAQYKPSRVKLYLLSTTADIAGGNFPGSYFFVPFLYQMTAQAKGGDVYAITAGKQQPVYLPLNNADERNMVHLYGEGLDVIPPQRPSGAGLDVFLAQAVQQPGFYSLAATGNDTTAIALNQDPQESELILWSVSQLKEGWKGANIHWMTPSSAAISEKTTSSFPLWKVCVLLSIIMLAAESWLLAARYRKVPSEPELMG
jgi:hypothetical protein